MVDRVEMARQAIERAEKLTENWVGPCHECKYRIPWRLSSSSREVSEWDTCSNDIARLAIFKPHSGFDGDLPECRNVRSKSGLCGPEGKLFESKKAKKVEQSSPDITEPAKGFWASLFS